MHLWIWLQINQYIQVQVVSSIYQTKQDQDVQDKTLTNPAVNLFIRQKFLGWGQPSVFIILFHAISGTNAT